MKLRHGPVHVRGVPASLGKLLCSARPQFQMQLLCIAWQNPGIGAVSTSNMDALFSCSFRGIERNQSSTSTCNYKNQHFGRLPIFSKVELMKTPTYRKHG